MSVFITGEKVFVQVRWLSGAAEERKGEKERGGRGGGAQSRANLF